VLLAAAGWPVQLWAAQGLVLVISQSLTNQSSMYTNNQIMLKCNKLVNQSYDKQIKILKIERRAKTGKTITSGEQMTRKPIS
jgi:hypothetical protein